MPRGGARPGAGRKPKTKPEGAVVLGMDGQRFDPSAIPPALDLPQVPGADFGKLAAGSRPSTAGTAAASPPPTEASDGEAPDLARPPADLRIDEKKIWATLAPFAIQQGTLIAATAGGFRQLCQTSALAQRLLRAIYRRPTARESESAIRLFTRLDQRTDAMMARFKLTAFGKPADAGFTAQAKTVAPAAAPHAWGRVAGKGGA